MWKLPIPTPTIGRLIATSYARIICPWRSCAELVESVSGLKIVEIRVIYLPGNDTSRTAARAATGSKVLTRRPRVAFQMSSPHEAISARNPLREYVNRIATAVTPAQAKKSHRFHPRSNSAQITESGAIRASTQATSFGLLRYSPQPLMRALNDDISEYPPEKKVLIELRE